jgi:hypothetical protein
MLALTTEHIFKNISAKTDQKFLVSVSMYQLHTSFSKGRSREFVVDLINPDTSKTLVISEYRDSVDDAAEIVCSTADQLATYLNQGFAIHRVLSERSAADKGHVVVDIRVESTEKNDPVRITYGTLRFAVLAGAGGRAVDFNSGLKEFNTIVSQRAKNVDEFEITYTASKLTQLLQSSLSAHRANAFGTFLLFLSPAQEATDMLALASKVQSLSTACKVNFNTIASAVSDLREEIRRRRDAFRLDNPTTFVQDVRPDQIHALQRLVLELERVKSQTWRVRRENSAAVLRQRVARLKAEGLVGVLLSGSVEIPAELKIEAKEKLRALIGKHNAIRAQEDKVETVRHKFLTLSKKMKPDAAAGDKVRAQVEKQQQALRQEELALNKQVSVYNGALTEYSTAQKKILALETKKSKLFLFPEDAAALMRARDQEAWQELKKDREELLDGEYKGLQERAEALAKEIEAATDVDTCKKLLASLADQLGQKDLRVRELEVDKDLVTAALYRKDADNEHQMQRFQEHMFFVFRNYRSHFEEQKTRIEGRYRDLLENAVKDALKLQEENNRMRTEMMKRVSM